MSKLADHRPRAILAIEVVSASLFVCDLALAELDGGFGTAVEVASAGILVALAFLVTRRRSDFARIILTILFVGGVALTLYFVAFEGLAFSEFGPIEIVLLAFVWGLTITEMGLLWSKPTSRWIADRYVDSSESSAERH